MFCECSRSTIKFRSFKFTNSTNRTTGGMPSIFMEDAVVQHVKRTSLIWINSSFCTQILLNEFVCGFPLPGKRTSPPTPGLVPIVSLNYFVKYRFS